MSGTAAAALVPPRNRLERILVIVLGLLTVALVVGLVLALRAPDPFDPLSFEPQRIEAVDPITGEVRVPTVPGFEGIPAVRLSDPVPVVGVRCTATDDPLDVLGSVWWARTDPAGTRIQVLDGFAATVEPGCVPLRFDNPIPAGVAALVTEDGRPSQWTIAGTVQPVDANGVAAAWTTESFWILPDE